MATLVLGPPPPELTGFLERRRSLGQDLYDEMWEGVYHVAPAPNAWRGYAVRRVAQLLSAATNAAGFTVTSPFNLGERDDYRVPDLGCHRDLPTTTFVPTAAIVVEVVSPDDQSYAKLPFYVAHAVDEVLVVDARSQSARWFVNSENGYEERDASRLVGVASADIAAGLR
jgi:Uma2 family endonuclease